MWLTAQRIESIQRFTSYCLSSRAWGAHSLSFSGCHNMRALGIPYVCLLTWWYSLGWKLKFCKERLSWHRNLFFLWRCLFCQLSLGMCVKATQVTFIYLFIFLKKRQIMYFAVSFGIFETGADTCLCFRYCSGEHHQVTSFNNEAVTHLVDMLSKCCTISGESFSCKSPRSLRKK